MSEPTFNHSAHIELWDWLSKNPEKNKCDWPGWKYNGGDLEGGINNCFACVYATRGVWIDCSICPLVWPNKLSDCEEDIYFDWYSAIDRGSYQVASLLAEEIRDLPVRPGVKCV